MPTPTINNVFIDLNGIEDAVLVTISGPLGSYSFALGNEDILLPLTSAGDGEIIGAAAKCAVRRYYDRVNNGPS
jgi:hypothetical protein